MSGIYYDDLDSYSGTIWEVLVSIYEDAEPEVEEGAFEQNFYYDKAEAQAAFERQCKRGDLAKYFDEYSDVPEYDTVGVFLLQRDMLGGKFLDTYFSDDVIDKHCISK